MTNRLAIPMSVAASALALVLMMSGVNAQTSGGGSGGGGAGGATSGAGGAGAAGSAAARRSGGGATTRSTPGGTPNQATPNPALNSNPALQGQTAVPTPETGSGQVATPGAAGTKGDGNSSEQGSAGTRATNRGNIADPTPNTQKQANSPNDQSQPTQNQPLTGGGSARREGAAGHDMKTCMATWDKGTHITKPRWREICARTLKDQEAVRREAQSYSPKRR